MAEEQQAFVEACAQIIPVLVLALVADPLGRKDRAGYSGLVLFALLVGVVGELFALVAVGVGTDATTNLLVSLSMVVLAIAIIAPHAVQHFGNIRRVVPPRWRFMIGRAFYIVCATPFVVSRIPTLPTWLQWLAWAGLAIAFVWGLRADVRQFREIKKEEQAESSGVDQEVQSPGKRPGQPGPSSEEGGNPSDSGASGSEQGTDKQTGEENTEKEDEGRTERRLNIDSPLTSSRSLSPDI